MGFVFTLIYVGLTILSPAALFEDAGAYRIMLWVAVAALAASVPAILKRNWFSVPQFCLVVGFIGVICVSRIFNTGPGSVPQAISEFMPAVMVFFLILWHVSSMQRFRWLTVLLIAIALYSVGRGMYAYFTADHLSVSASESEADSKAGEHPYLYVQPVEDSYGQRSSYMRVRALGVLNDPNDFAQFLLMLVPFLMLSWQPKRFFRNVCVCVLPAAAILLAIYLTFSRGALLAIAVLAMFLLKDKLGTRRSAFLTPLVIVLTLAFNQTGRSISVKDDSALGRVNAWSDGLGMFQSSPLWGIGFNLFGEHHERTAHNSFVLCLSELGLLGSFLWVGLIVVSVLAIQNLIRNSGAPEPAPDRQWAMAVRYSLYAVLVTSWFLSRTYCVTLYLVLGMATAITGLEVPDQGQRKRIPWPAVTLAVLPLLIGAVYITVRMRSI